MLRSHLKEIFKPFADVVNDLSLTEYELIYHLYQKFPVKSDLYNDELTYWNVRGYFEKVVIPHKIQVWEKGMFLMNQTWFEKFLTRTDHRDLFKSNLFYHDLSKFSNKEAFAYAAYDRKTGFGESEFKEAWKHHKIYNPHHAGHYHTGKYSKESPKYMPKIYVLEMVADQMSGDIYGTPYSEWVRSENGICSYSFDLHSRLNIIKVLNFLGIPSTEDNGRVVCL